MKQGSDFQLFKRLIYLNKRIAILGIILVSLLFSLNSTAQTLYVDSSVTISGDGSSWANAYKELRDAISFMQNNNIITEIDVAKGTYIPNNVMNTDSSFCLYRGNIKIYGGYPNGGGTRDIINNPVKLSGLLAAGVNCTHVIVIAGLSAIADSVVLDGLTITNGNATTSPTYRIYNGQYIGYHQGGGLCMIGNLNGNKIGIRNCVFTTNTANIGAGILNISSGGATISNCNFIANTGVANLTIGTYCYGIGIYNYQSSPLITNCVFSGMSNSRSGYGLCIYNELSTSVIANCNFINNTGPGIHGVGVCNKNGATVTVTNCLFQRNQTYTGSGMDIGGGMYNETSSLTVNYCSFLNNSCSHGAAGICIKSSPNVSITNSTFFGNISRDPTFGNGGGLSADASSPVITNCAFIKDTCNAFGGAIYTSSGASPLATNCTFYGNINTNWPSASGAAVYCADSSGGKYRNCIFWKDTVTYNPIVGRYEFYSANDGSRPSKPRPSLSYSIIQSPFPILNVIDSGNNRTIYPLFADTTAANIAGADGIYGTGDDGLRLQLCSPGIDAGDNSAIPEGITTDIKNDPRINNNVVDLGAYENPSPVITGITPLAVSGDSTIRSVYSPIAMMTNCSLISSISPSGANPVSAGVMAKVTIDATMSAFTLPYVLRHYNIVPSVNAASATATVTLYFYQSDFNTYNVNRGSYPSLPIDAADVANNKANLLVHQFHGSNGPGAEVIIIPSSVSWNSTNSWWEVTFNVSGFSRFYLSTATSPLPVVLEYFTGSKQENSISLNWKANCYNSSLTTFSLERSSTNNTFNGIYTIDVSEQVCQFPLSYTDNYPLPGNNSYRLKITDINGKITYSNIILFNISSSNNIIVSPTILNPDQLLNISVQDKGYIISIYNSNGSLLHKTMLREGTNTIKINWSTGICFYRITNNNQQTEKTGKLIIE